MMLNIESKSRNLSRGSGSMVKLKSNSKSNGDKRNTSELPSVATINIRNLRLRTYIGFNPDERVKRQDVVINIEIDYYINKGVLSDEVDVALNYKVITKKVIKRVEDGQFLLLEKLVADILAICSDHPDINRACVTVDKPNALRFADSVSLTLEYRCDQQSTNVATGEN
ncbi:MAG: dihydroneopterin triphosphate 2'-epimerase [Arenicellales bacterium]|nr:dihydroneopterin triphosphate 2'-epimerase [Arenicellales bacterium]